MHFTTYTAASLLAALASAQTFTDCNPMEKECPNDPAMPQNFETDFTKGQESIKGWKQTAGSLTYTAEGAEFIVAKKGDAPTIGTESMFHFGYAEVVMKAAPGQGIISSIVLQSNNLDEVDWEWIGGVDSRVQMNYFGKGNTTTFDRMTEANVANNQNEFHKYALNWTQEALTWIVDDVPQRTLKFADANGGKNYPQTPCNLRLGNWPGGDSENEGTVQWAGGKVDYSKAPFKMVVKSIKVINYSPGKEYKWTDKTGSFESIEVIEPGKAEGAPQNTNVIQPSAAPGEAGQLPEVYPTGVAGEGASTTCTTGAAGSVQSTGSPVLGGQTDFDYPTPAPGAPKPSTPASNDENSEEGDDCDCGTETVTVTGAPPPATNAPSLAITSEYAAVPIESARSKFSTAVSGGVTGVPQPPFPTSGIAIDTRPAPSVPAPSIPASTVPRPSSNGTIPAPPAEFTGAASANKAGVLVGALAGAIVLAF